MDDDVGTFYIAYVTSEGSLVSAALSGQNVTLELENAILINYFSVVLDDRYVRCVPWTID